jgi:predicted membrane protein
MSQDPKIDDAVERIVVNKAESIAAGFQRIVQLVIGLGVVTAGVLFTLDNLGILRARDYLRFWPIVFVAIGAGLIIQGQTQRRFLAGGFWILLGVLMLSRRLGLTDLNVWDFWPFILIAVGSRIVWHGFHGTSWPRTAVDNISRVSSTAFMGGFGRKIVSQEFRSADLTALMGGGKIDLRDAALADGQATLNLFVLMGGFEIIIPPTWKVIMEISPFMGGFEDKTRPNTTDTAPRLYVRGFVMMGGVEVKNPRD